MLLTEFVFHTFQNKASNEEKKIECKLMLRNEYSDNYKLGIKYVIRKRLLTLHLCKLNVSNSHHMSFILKVICPDSMIQVSQGLTVAVLT